MAKNSKPLEVTISSVQNAFIEALMAEGEISHDKSMIVQHLIWMEIERRRAEGRLPKMLVVRDGEKDDEK